MPKVCPVCGNTYSDSNAFCPTDGTTLRSADVDGDLIGTVVADRYLVTDLLGEGGMGRVYLARHVRLPQQAAIKVLRPALLRDPASVARFNREASNASRIEHERVARVFDFGETSDGTVYLAMEYVPGRTLKRLLTEEAPLEPVRAAALIKQVADGLDAAHRMGIVHRDLKPDNILVLTDDVLGDRAKVVDFGIAKAIGGDTNERGLTQTGFVVGTPEFMAPEQMLGGVIDGRTDMYALALVAFQCLTNVLPFDTTTPDRGLTARLTEEPRRLDLVAAGVEWPLELQAVFDKALTRDIEKRYPTAGAFADALVRAVQTWVGAAPPVSAPVLVLATASLAGGASGTRPAAARSDERRSEAGNTLSDDRGGASTLSKGASTRSRTPMLIGGGVVVGIGVIVGVAMMLKSGATTTAGAAPHRDGSNTAQQAAAPTPVITAPVKETTTTLPVGQSPPPVTVAKVPATAKPGAGANQGAKPGAKAPETTLAGPPATSSASAAAARDTVESLKRYLGTLDGPQTEAKARSVIIVLRRLLPRLDSRVDSTWAYFTIANAHGMAGELDRACEPLRRAKRLAVTEDQHAALRQLSSQLTCAP